MDPVTLSLIVAGIQAAIKAAPDVIKVVKAGKDMIAGLFEAGLIDAATQDRLHSWVDDTVTAFQAGNVPPEFTVEPDPVS